FIAAFAALVDRRVHEAHLRAEAQAAEREAVRILGGLRAPAPAQFALVEEQRAGGWAARDAVVEVGPAHARDALVGKTRGERERDVQVVPGAVEEQQVVRAGVGAQPARRLRDARRQGRGRRGR